MYKVWHWLQNWQIRKYKQFWLWLLLISAIGHVFLLVVFFRQRAARLNLVVHAKSREVEVVLVPMYKKMPLVAQQIAQAKKTSAKSNLAAKPKAQAPAVKPVSPKKPAKKAVTKPVIAKVAPVKKAPVKAPVKKKVDLKLKEVKKEEPVKEVTPEPVAVAGPIYIGTQDLQDLQLMGELQAALIQNWQPPIGFGSDLECLVELLVGASGNLEKIEIKKSSGIFAYDLSVKQNLHNLQLPKAFINKTIIVIFKP